VEALGRKVGSPESKTDGPGTELGVDLYEVGTRGRGVGDGKGSGDGREFRHGCGV
jgi:hypothetical protein